MIRHVSNNWKLLNIQRYALILACRYSSNFFNVSKPFFCSIEAWSPISLSVRKVLITFLNFGSEFFPLSEINHQKSNSKWIEIFKNNVTQAKRRNDSFQMKAEWRNHVFVSNCVSSTNVSFLHFKLKSFVHPFSNVKKRDLCCSTHF